MKRIIGLIISLVFMVIITGCFSDNTDTSYTVERVVDGDTIIVNFNGVDERVRLIGVDTPESVHLDPAKNVEFGKVSSDFTKDYLEGKKVVLEFDIEERDQYGRLLAYVYIDDKMFNQILLEQGMAKVVVFPPNIKYLDNFKEIERKARENNKGLWSMLSGVDSSITPPVVNMPSNNSSDPAINLDQTKDGKWIKGNKNSFIYHVPGGIDYNKISPKNIVWFETEKDAQAAGYKRAKQ